MRHHLAVSYCLHFRVVRGYLCWELSEEQQDDEGSSSSSPDRMVSQGADLPGALEKKNTPNQLLHLRSSAAGLLS